LHIWLSRPKILFEKVKIGFHTSKLNFRLLGFFGPVYRASKESLVRP